MARARWTEMRLVLIVLGGLLLAACAAEDAVTELRGATMGTTYSVKVVDLPAAASAEALGRAVDEVLERVDGEMSTYRADSQVSRFNASDSTDWLAVSPGLVAVVREALRISERTGGAFDVTVGPLVDLWGFGPVLGEDRVPPEGAIRATRARVGYDHLRVRERPPAVRKDRRDRHLDLSAIAKGYAVDQVAELLEARGLRRYLVEVGGEVRGRGLNGRGVAWRVAIERPEAGARRVYRVVELQDGGIATSGDYRNYFEQQGRRYSHTIDPRTGRPVTHALASVSVLDPSVMRADALATALMVLGPEAGYDLADHEGIAALFIIRSPDGLVDRATPAFARGRGERVGRT